MEHLPQIRSDELSHVFTSIGDISILGNQFDTSLLPGDYVQ